MFRKPEYPKKGLPLLIAMFFRRVSIVLPTLLHACGQNTSIDECDIRTEHAFYALQDELVSVVCW